jgi:hypothetical protein
MEDKGRRWGGIDSWEDVIVTLRTPNHWKEDVRGRDAGKGKDTMMTHGNISCDGQIFGINPSRERLAAPHYRPL